MTTINLLPWRERKREQEKKQFMSLLLASILSAIGLVLAINYYASRLVDGQTNRNQRLQTEITQLDGQIIEIKKLKEIRNNLISRMKIVHGLQARRTLTVHLFDELIKVLPDDVYLTELKRTEDTITVEGYSDANTSISFLMRNIEKNPWIQNPVLTEIKKTEDKITDKTNDEDNNEFSLSFSLKPDTAGEHSL